MIQVHTFGRQCPFLVLPYIVLDIYSGGPTADALRVHIELQEFLAGGRAAPGARVDGAAALAWGRRRRRRPNNSGHLAEPWFNVPRNQILPVRGIPHFDIRIGLVAQTVFDVVSLDCIGFC